MSDKIYQCRTIDDDLHHQISSLSRFPDALAHPMDALSDSHDPSDFVDDDDNNDVHQPSDAPNVLRGMRAQYGHKRTHNEQIIVAPCGVIIA
jgi:hypothetical protein